MSKFSPSLPDFSSLGVLARVTLAARYLFFKEILRTDIGTKRGDIHYLGRLRHIVHIAIYLNGKTTYDENGYNDFFCSLVGSERDRDQVGIFTRIAIWAPQIYWRGACYDQLPCCIVWDMVSMTSGPARLSP